MNKIKIPDFLKKMNKIFVANGFEAYLVGGALRDILMKKNPADYDLATNAPPFDVIKIFKKVIPTGIAHGTVTVHYMKNEIEVTTFRTESEYSDGRHPDNVSYATTIQEDLSRRDFTINAIAANLKDGKIIDLFKGQKDIKNKIIRTVGNPVERFTEDGLRPIRAIRFANRLEFKIEKNTLEAICNEKVLEKTKSISIERFRDEFEKILKSEKPSSALKIMENCKLLEFFIPELLEGRNCIQKDVRGYHIFDVLDHNLYACDGSPKEKLNVRLAALFHDIGKPRVKVIKQSEQGEIYTFFNHEKTSSIMTREIMFRLRFSNALIDNVCHLIECHMFYYEPTWSSAAVRRFLAKVKKENIEDLIDLRLADMYGKYNQDVRLHDSIACKNLIEFQDRIEELCKENTALNLKDLAVNGKDLIQIGINPGKNMGKILNSMLETVLDDPAMNTKEKLLEIALKMK